MSKVVVIVVPIIAVFFLSNLILSIVFSYNYKNYELDKTINALLDSEFNKKLIYSFRKSTDKCNSEEETLVLGTFDGSSPRCLCPGGAAYTASCTEAQKSCQNFDGEPKDYTIFNNIYICIKRGTETYIDLLKNNKLKPKGQPCDSGYRSCGIVDSLENQLCIKDEEQCPITEIDIENLEYLNEEKIQKYKNYKSLDMGNGFVMYYLNEGNENNTIISIIKLSEGYPCINPGEKYWNSHDSEYKNNLAQCSTFNGKSRDDRYIRFNYYTTKKELYEENGLEGYITRNIQLDSEKIYLYGRTFYGFNKVENELNYNEFKETQDYLNKYNGILSVTRIVIFVIVGLPLCCVGGIGGLGAGAGDNCSGEAGIAVLGWL